MTNFDPHTVTDAILRTTADQLEADEVYQRSLALAQAVQDLHGVAHESPRWSNLWDQAARSSSGVLLNFAQGCSKLKGHTQSDWLCARGELGELIATLTLAIPLKHLKDDAKELYRLLDSRIVGLAAKPNEKWSRWN
ncbi:four helix bundle protein [Limnoglobus roseus]|uniref:Four helix bundle protein n=1 Tax=Limnoglobus roseus TaxID=2598579 RepID=A0A5C1A6H5_9BACT|nr:four helix bundle protein [Limnoglobus roseus]QEL13863.1 hypothetical protein PX52LOC_00721 [Limnoglobus roseus]